MSDLGFGRVGESSLDSCQMCCSLVMSSLRESTGSGVVC